MTYCLHLLDLTAWLGGTRFYKRNLNLYNSYAKKNPKLDPRYIFINSGFNLRPTDIQGVSSQSV